MSDIQVRLVPQTLPAGFCPATEQARLVKYCDYTKATIAVDATVFNIGTQTPSPDKRGNPWIRLNPSDGCIDRIYKFSLGSWTSQHQDFAGKIILWGGDISTIATLDGGSAGAVTATTGPFWEEVTEARGRFPIHPDTAPTLLSAALAVGATGGEEKHANTADEIPEHTHLMAKIVANVVATGAPGGAGAADNGSDGSQTGVNTTAKLAHNNMPPYIGIWLIRRTARKYYSIPG